MSRFLSWLALGVAAAFLVVATVSFSPAATAALAFAISIGTLIVSAAVAFLDRTSVASVYTAALIALISAWTIVASLVFSRPTVQNLALGASLAIGGSRRCRPDRSRGLGRTRRAVGHGRYERTRGEAGPSRLGPRVSCSSGQPYSRRPLPQRSLTEWRKDCRELSNRRNSSLRNSCAAYGSELRPDARPDPLRHHSGLRHRGDRYR